jgi:tRNA-dihydrouridine synthase
MHQQCADLGYTEVNLNLGCPSGTVTAKGKGSGMLIDADALDRFLDAVFRQSVVDISVKTRIGFQDSREFPMLLEIFNRYPIKELTVHPRVRSAFYTGAVDMDAFSYCMQNSKNPVCYNGDLRSLSDISACTERFPELEAVMVGRGLIADQGMFTPGGTTVENLEAFYNELLEQYLVAFGGSRNAMFRLKEHWGMLITRFEGSEKLWKEIRKTTDLQQFRQLTKQVFHTLPLAH